MMNPPKVSFILVNYFSREHTVRCIESIIRETKDIHYEIVVVDNHSDLETEAFTHSFPDFVFLRNDRNLGYGMACDRGARAARGRYLFFINNDTGLLNDAGHVLAEYLDVHLDVALVGPQLINLHGERIPSFDYFPTLSSKVLGVGLLRLFAPGKFPRKDTSVPTGVDLVAGACLFIRAEVYQALGGFDPQFFLCCEEEDLAMRVHKAGYRVHFVPAARIMHASGGSSKDPPALKKEFYISFFKFYRQHYGTAKTAGVKCLSALQFIWRYLAKSDRFIWASLLRWVLRGAPEEESLRFAAGNSDDATLPTLNSRNDK